MPNSRSQYVKELNQPDYPQHELVLSLWVATAGVAAVFTKFNTLQAQGEDTLTIPDFGTYPYCFLHEKPKYSQQRKHGLPNNGGAGYHIQVTLLFEQTRLA